MTVDDLKLIMPHAGTRADLYGPYLDHAMAEFQIDTPKRQAAFLAQIAHESGELRYVRELATGEDYDYRKDLGNARAEAIRIAYAHHSTPGRFWRGRGLLQLTGFDNYKACSAALGRDFVDEPALLEHPYWAAMSAAWFWDSRGLSELADAGKFLELSIRINGRNKTGLPNGWGARKAYLEVATALFEDSNLA